MSRLAHMFPGPGGFRSRREQEIEQLLQASPPNPHAVRLVDLRLLKVATEDISGRQYEAVERFIRSGVYRELTRITRRTLKALDDLDSRFPNFTEVTAYYRRFVSLNSRGTAKTLSVPPVLLNGDPGIGKTRYSESLAKALGAEFHEISCSTVTANFVLSGGTSAWNESKPGKIHDALRDGRTANPIVLADEIDKLGGDSRYDGFGPLYCLLERSTARRFVDEYFGLPMDCSHILWIATANCLDAIPKPILSRLRVIDVCTPTRAQMAPVIRSIYADILNEHKDWAWTFRPELDDSIIVALGSATPRDIRRVLLDACGHAAMRSKADETCVVLPRDLMSPVSSARRRIGFVQ